MKLIAGTSGFSYKEWKGPFYPEDLPDGAMLRYYAEHLSAVEINNTFYRMPSRETLVRWAREVPDDFSFILKAPRRITHEKRLQGAGGDVSHLIEVAGALAGKMGPILFQLPPFARRDRPRLEEFLASLPPGARAAFEFRNASWFDEEIYEALRSRGAALCVADTDEGGVTPVVATADWGYVRLRRTGYDEAALHSWVARIREQPWERAFVFFKHEDAGAGPRLATRFQEICGR